MSEIRTELLERKDIPELLQFYNRLWKDNRDVKKFHWEFFEAPAGPAIYIVAKTASGQIIGSQCAIPIHIINAKGEVMLTAKSEDTLIDPAFRGKGVLDRMYDHLFEEGAKQGYHYIWGFTTAKKPLLKNKFKLPYSHSQSLLVTEIFPAYRYLSSLNPQNKFVSRMKIFALTCAARFKAIGRKRPMKNAALSQYKLIAETKENMFTVPPVSGFLSGNDFAIHQDSAYMKWRIADNPNYPQAVRVAFLNGQRAVGEVIFNYHKNHCWYLNCDQYSNEIPEEQRTAMFAAAVDHLIRNYGNASLIRTWDFKHNEHCRRDTQRRAATGFFQLERGLYFVWRPVGNDFLQAENFVLSRIGSQGTI